ncbi:MAG: hypothetical protein R2939_01840 [Kofleriaceae bacterium]
MRGTYALVTAGLLGGLLARPAVADVPGEIGDQEVGVGAAIAAGGDLTAGGVRVSGRYLYQLAEDDWFDGAVGFTYGGGGVGCVDVAGELACDRGRLRGAAVEVTAGVRRRFTGRGRFVPHVRVAVGGRLVRFGDDDLGGFAIPVVAAGGIRVRVTPGIAIGAEAALESGIAWFGRGLGAEPQLGMVVGGQVEFRLR